MSDESDSALERQEPEDGDHRSPPIFNLPNILVLTLGFLAILYVVQEYLLDEDTRARFIVALAFSPSRYVFSLADQDLEWLWTPLTYSFVHGSIEHIVFNCLWLMAFGAPVVRRIGTIRYVIFWILSSVVAAFFHAALNWGDPTLLIGASGVVSGLMGAACRFAFPGRRGYDRNYGHLYPRQSIAGAFRNRTVVTFTAMWLVGNILIAFGITFIGDNVGPIAWDAHIGGFLFGFLLFDLFDPLPPASMPLTEP